MVNNEIRTIIIQNDITIESVYFLQISDDIINFTSTSCSLKSNKQINR